MKEKQNIEYKQNWQDDYLKWICGFANAQGGKLFIGKNDKGLVTGIANAKKLLEDIPNKVRDILGIMIDVNLVSIKGKDVLEIAVEPYPYPISYKGKYHYRSGSTKQELKGAVLDKFLLGKQGKRWDGVPVPKVFAKDLDKAAFNSFRKRAVKSKRLSEEDIRASDNVLLENLHLAEGDYLKRAAVLLFHPDPEKFITGAYVKIGYFKTDDDLLFQDEIHGSLFEQIEKGLDLLLTKYLKANISYEGVNRVEEYPFPEAALREAFINAVTHKDYSGGVPVQISVYSNKIIFWNEGQLPENWTVKKLVRKHPSIPYNPNIANTFFRAGLIEAWGRGTLKIISECVKAKMPVPEYKYDLSGFIVEMHRREVATSPDRLGDKLGDRLGDRWSDKWSDRWSEQLSKRQIEILKLILGNPKISRKKLSEILNINPSAIQKHLAALKNLDVIKRIGLARNGHWEVIEKTRERKG
ncbi:MAG: transcriptional regulator [Elusimicrobia bacterium HGW-Elusimicrobia-2]|nr:MAG: transcriptional regulator [Elusimicrobia bacterium HGW-Elusimicrobia-2]